MSNRQNFFVLIFLTQSTEVEKREEGNEYLPFKVHHILFEVHVVLQNECNAKGTALPLAPVGF